mgnify:CR=1 FL=1
MSLQSELDLLTSMTKLPSATRASLGLPMSQLMDIQVKAIRITAEWVIDNIVAPAMGRVKRPGDYSGGNSAGTDPPKSRTASLLNSLTVVPGRIDPYSQSVLIAVNPNAVDASEGGRLQLYSRYLETGWTRSPRRSGRQLRRGRNGDTWEKKFKVPGLRQPPRPYIRQIFIRNQVDRIRARFRWEIRRSLPIHIRHLANRFLLDVRYVPPFSFNEFSGGLNG